VVSLSVLCKEYPNYQEAINSADFKNYTGLQDDSFVLLNDKPSKNINALLLD
jgi:hypothetical protein